MDLEVMPARKGSMLIHLIRLVYSELGFINVVMILPPNAGR